MRSALVVPIAESRVEMVALPGAAISGLRTASMRGPRLLKVASVPMVSLLVNCQLLPW